MSKNVLANVAGMIDFEIKDVTVKQITLNVTDMDKINIVSTQAVLKMPSFSTDTCSKSTSPLMLLQSLRKVAKAIHLTIDPSA